MRFVALFALLTVACGGSVQVLEHTKTAGTISVAGSDESVRSRADEFMRAHCRGSYTLVDERPVADGWKMAYRCDETRALGPEARIDGYVLAR